jgi:uncharacterized membrane protein YeiH
MPSARVLTWLTAFGGGTLRDVPMARSSTRTHT